MDFNLNAVSFVAEKNFSSLDEKKIYDVLIIGGGPAGLTAAVYCMRKGVATGLIVKKIGGQMTETSGIENYMGYRYVNGSELVAKFKDQVMQFGIDYEEGSSITSIAGGEIKKVFLEDKRTFSARALIIATGKSWRKLNVPGEEEFRGRGVAYCSTCDAPFFSGKSVVVVGGGNSGIEAAIDLANVASRVIVVQFLEKLTGDSVLIERLRNFGNVEVIYNSEVLEIRGGVSMETVRVRDRQSGTVSDMTAQGIFVEIGLIPNSGFAGGLLELNGQGEIIVDCSCRTSAAGIFAAGDVTSVQFKQIIVAAGEGAKAALSACSYLLSRT